MVVTVTCWQHRGPRLHCLAAGLMLLMAPLFPHYSAVCPVIITPPHPPHHPSPRKVLSPGLQIILYSTNYPVTARAVACNPPPGVKRSLFFARGGFLFGAFKALFILVQNIRRFLPERENSKGNFLKYK